MIELEGAPPTSSRRMKKIKRTVGAGIPVRIGPNRLPHLYVKDLVGSRKLIIPVLWAPHGGSTHTDSAEHTLTVPTLHVQILQYPGQVSSSSILGLILNRGSRSAAPPRSSFLKIFIDASVNAD